MKGGGYAENISASHREIAFMHQARISGNLQRDHTDRIGGHWKSGNMQAFKLSLVDIELFYALKDEIK